MKFTLKSPQELQGWIVLGAYAQLSWTGSNERGFELEYRPDATEPAKPLRVTKPCEALHIVPEQFSEPDWPQYPGNEEVVSALSMPDDTKLSLRTAPGQSKIATLAIDSGDHVWLLDQADTELRVGVRRWGDHVFGWVQRRAVGKAPLRRHKGEEGRMGRAGAGNQKVGLIGLFSRSDTPPRKESLQICPRALPLFAWVGSPADSIEVGAVSKSTPLRVRARRGELTEIELPTVSWITVEKGATLAVPTGDLSTCSKREVQLGGPGLRHEEKWSRHDAVALRRGR